jgi:plasmid stabilization system protein ParE
MEESAGWYERRKPGLGDEFLAEVDETLARICEHPAKWRAIDANVRGCRMHRFPFAVVYRLRKQAVEIVAVSHYSRLPGYWKGRVET